VSRNTDPIHSLVVSVTSFRTATDAYNVIPETVELRGTVRTFDPKLRAHAEARVKAIAVLKWPRAAGPFLAAVKLEGRLLVVLYQAARAGAALGQPLSSNVKA
jgi:hippurate hydrolase